MNPGDVRNFNCTEYCINGTLNVTCDNCPGCNTTNVTCPSCSIHTSLSWNQTYKNNETPCDIEIYCESMNLTQMGIVNFPARMKVKKDGGNFLLSIDVFDRNGMVLESWNKQISEQDVVEYTYEYNYSCPAELTTNVNMETCAPFLENVFNTTNPMVFQMVTGQSVCMQRLVDCQSRMDSKSDVAHYWEREYNRILDQYNDMESLYNGCFLEMDYNNPNSTLRKAVLSTRQEKAGWVEPHWFGIAILELLILVSIIVWMFFGGGGPV